MNKIIRTIIKIACIKGINYVPISIFLALSTNSGCDNISLVTFIKVNKTAWGGSVLFLGLWVLCSV